jgi:gliding motility-associated-like protein
MVLSGCVGSLFGQRLSTQWAHAITGPSESYGEYLAVNRTTGETYLTGSFYGDIDFDHGAGNATLTADPASSMYIAKYAANGAFVWAHAIPVARPAAVVVDNTGDLIIVGAFEGTVDFDPDPGDDEELTAALSDAFFLKFSPAGDLVWARSLAGTGQTTAEDIGFDANNALYATGMLYGQSDFDMNSGTNLINGGTEGDVYIFKIFPNGNTHWVSIIAGGEYDQVESIAVENSSTPFISLLGEFIGETDFDPSDGLEFRTATDFADMFLLHLDENGDYHWVQTFASTGTMSPKAVEVDASGNVHAVGNFSGTVDLDPTSGEQEVASNNEDIFLLKFEGASGVPMHLLALQGEERNTVSGIAIQGAEVSITGLAGFEFHPDPLDGSEILEPQTDRDIFVSVYNLDGEYQDAKIFPGLVDGADEESLAIVADNSGKIYVSGYIYDQTDFSTSVCSPFLLTTAGTTSSFMVQFDMEAFAPCITFTKQPQTTFGCRDDFVALTAEAGGTTGIAYQWQGFNGSIWQDLNDIGGDGDEESYMGTTTSTLTIFIWSGAPLNNLFRVIVSGDEVSDLISDEVDVPVTGVKPGIPYAVATSRCGEGSILFTASGSPTGTYRWFEDGAELDGISSDTYRIETSSSHDDISVAIQDGGCVGDEVVVIASVTACADVPGLVSVGAVGGTETTEIMSMKVDAAGNQYVIGYFLGTVDINPGSGVQTVASGVADEYENFIIKVGPDGELIWHRLLGNISTVLLDVAVGSTGIYLTGGFGDIIDSDPGPTTTPFNMIGDNDMFVMKLNLASGDLIWARQIGGTAASVRPRAIAVDASGNVYTTGNYIDGAIDFDPGPGTANLLYSGTRPYIFVSKLDNNGNYAWAHRMGTGAVNVATGNAIAIDATGNVYTTGLFQLTVDFDPGAGNFSLTTNGATDVYIQKLTAAGAFVHAIRIGGTGAEEVTSIAFDATGNPHLTGTFTGAVNFGATALNSSTGMVFVTKLDPSLNFIWSKNFSNNFGAEMLDIAVDATGNVYTTGYAETPGDFDPGPGQYLLNSGINREMVVSQLLSNGDFGWAYSLGSSGRQHFDNEATSIGLDAAGNIFVAGYVLHGADMDPGHCTQLFAASGGRSGFIQKVRPGVKSLCLTRHPEEINTCDGITIELKAEATGTTNITYQWQRYSFGLADFYNLDEAGEFSGTTTNTLTIEINSSDGNATYRVIASGDDAAPVTSNQAQVNVGDDEPPEVLLDYTACAPQSFTLEATGGSDGDFVWYEDQFDDDPIAGEVNGTFVTPVISSSTTYYVAFDGSVCGRVPVEIDITSNVPPPAVTDDSACNGPASLTLIATGATNGEYRWYEQESGGLAIAGEVNAMFNTPPVSVTTFYYVSINDGTCESARVEATAVIGGAVAPLASNHERCGPGTVLLNASGATDGQYRWYTSDSGVEAPISGEQNSTFTTPVLTVTTTYYVSIDNGSCESIRVPAVITINSTPTAPSVSASPPDVSCGPAAFTLTATGGTNGEYRWYTVSTGGTAETQFDNVLTTPTISITTSYYVALANGICESPRVPVSLVIVPCSVNSPPVIAPTEGNTIVGGTITVSLTPLLSDPDNNLDLTTLKIITPPISGASATIVNGELLINYGNISFTGVDQIGVEVCDLAGSCTTRTITINVTAGDLEYFNAVSPNGDGRNDTFHIENIDQLPDTQQNKVTIFNRWGDVVFEIGNYDNVNRVFSGKSNNGNELPSGIYFYKIEYRSGRPVTGYLSLKNN